MKKIIILYLVIFWGQYIQAMEQANEKRIRLALQDNRKIDMPESELPFFTAIGDMVKHEPAQESPYPLLGISLEAMEILRRDVPWALALHKKKNATVTLQEISNMDLTERMALARDVAQQESQEIFEPASIQESIDLGNAADRLGAYELIQKYACNIANMLQSDSSPLFGAILKNKIEDIEFDRITTGFQCQIEGLMPCSENWIKTAQAYHTFFAPKFVEVSGDGSMVFVYHKNNTVEIMKIDDEGNRWISDVMHHTSEDNKTVAVSADGKTVVTVSSGESSDDRFSRNDFTGVQIMQWRDEAWKKSHLIEGIGLLAGVSADGKTVIAVVEEQTKIVKWSDIKNKWIQTYNAYHDKNPISACISQDGNTVVIATDAMTQILRWHDQEKQWIEALGDDIEDGNAPAVVSADGNTVMGRFKDGKKILEWCDQKWMERCNIEGKYHSSIMSANGTTVVMSRGSSVMIHTKSEKTGTWSSQQVGHPQSYNWCRSAKVSADGHTMVITWELFNGGGYAQRLQWSVEQQQWIELNRMETKNNHTIRQVSISLDGAVTCVHSDLEISVNESSSMQTWDKKILEAFLKWCKKTGKPVTENAWIKRTLQRCDARERRSLFNQYDTLLRVLTQNSEKFE